MKKYNYLYALLIELSISAQAGIIDMASFRALPMAVVWGTDNLSRNSSAPVVSDLIVLTKPSQNSDLISGNAIPFLTGTLTEASETTNNQPLSRVNFDESDNVPNKVNNSLKKFVSRTTLEPILKSFYVASNCQFNIYAQAGSAISDVNEKPTIHLTMSISQSGTDNGISYGSKAQSPTKGGSGFIGFPVSLASLTSSTKIYEGGRKTAATHGSLTEQSVRFNIQYDILDAQKLAVKYLEIPVTYTIYIP